MRCSSVCYRRSAASQWKIFLPILVFCVYSCLNIRWLDSCLVVAGPAFVQPSRPLVRTRLSLAKKRQEQRQTEENHPRSARSIDVNNLLSNMGLQQVNATTTSNSTVRNTAATKNHPRKKKNKKNAAVGKTRLKFPEISLRTQLDYARNGHGVLRNFITDIDYEEEGKSESSSSPSNNKRLMNLRRDILDLAREEELKAWVQKVQVAAGKRNDGEFETTNHDLVGACRSIEGCQKALKDMGVTASLPFLQYFNTWRKLQAVKDLASDLGEAASILLDVPTVRLYQDAIFWKRSGDGPTPWHADARMAPFDTSHMITFWIPLQGVPSPRDGGTALIFCSKSHADFALPYWNNPPEENNNSTAENDDYESAWDRLEDRYPKKAIDYMPMSLGDVTVHSGWTLHCSNGNDIEGSKDRLALAITFADGAAEIRPNWQTIGDDEDRWSYQDWCNDVRPHSRFSHELVPIVWPPSRRDDTK